MADMSTSYQASWDGFFSALADDEENAVDVIHRMMTLARDCVSPGHESLLKLTASLEPSADDSGSGAVCWHMHGPKLNGEMRICTQLADLQSHRDELLSCTDGTRRALEIVAFALATACRGESTARWHSRDIESISPPVLADMEQKLNGFRMLSRDEQVEEHLRHGRDVLLYGNVGAGKTTTAIHQAIQFVAEGDSGLLWLDLSDPRESDESVALALLKMDHLDKILLVIDDVQANVSAARSTFDLVVQMRRNLGLPIVVLATGSPVTNEVEPPLCSTRLEPVLADGHALVRSILDRDESLDHEARLEITRLADGDAFLAEIALRLWRGVRRVPGRDEFADLVVSQISAGELSPEAQRLLYELACLSACEIHVGKRQVALLPPERAALPELINAKLIQFSDESYSIRHRSLARLLVVYGLRNWNQPTNPLPSPAIFAYDYLQRAGSAQIKATLDKLDLLPFDRDPSQRSTISIASAWRALGFLGDSLAHAVERDPGWGDTVASAAFAGMTLAKLGRRKAWERCAHFLRTRWSYERDDQLPIWVDRPSADLKTFESMRELMIAQRHNTAGDQVQNDASLTDIDAELACRNWMLGVLLCFEALSPDRDVARLERLCRIASNVIDGGPFYPRGAPWVTAQVIQGLCLAGHSYQSNPTVRQACDWLCEDRRVGGAYQAGWQNIVSVSTFDAMTTSLCFLALWQARCRNGEFLEIAYQKLRDEQHRLMSGPNHETELALIVEARLRHDDKWKDLSGPILNLLGWVRREQWSGREVNATEPGDPISASAKSPFIAAQLWIIIWAAAKQELPNLLKDALQIDTHVSPEGPWPPTDPSRRGAASQAYAPEEPSRTPAGIDNGRKLARLRQHIDIQLNDLAAPAKTLRLDAARNAVRRDIEYWQGIRDKLDSIEAEFDSGTATDSTSNRLNALGAEIFGKTWLADRKARKLTAPRA
jgi:hypothetical protein